MSLSYSYGSRPSHDLARGTASVFIMIRWQTPLLLQTKSFCQKTTMLQCVVTTLQASSSTALADCRRLLQPVHDASKFPLESIVADVRQLQAQLRAALALADTAIASHDSDREGPGNMTRTTAATSTGTDNASIGNSESEQVARSLDVRVASLPCESKEVLFVRTTASVRST